MKTFTIVGADGFKATPTLHKIGTDLVIKGDEKMSVSDGYHTMDDLYEHRFTLYISLCKQLAAERRRATEQGGMVKYASVWRSKLHADGTMYDGWFVLGIGKDAGDQITYHLPLKQWERTDFAETLEASPEFDGHSSDDVLERIAKL